MRPAALWLCLGVVACAPRALDSQGELIQLERGMDAAGVEAAMGRRPDEVRKLGQNAEDWIYLEPTLRRTFVVRMREGKLSYVQTLDQPGF
jgi:hypothetical protein